VSKNSRVYNPAFRFLLFSSSLLPIHHLASVITHWRWRWILSPPTFSPSLPAGRLIHDKDLVSRSLYPPLSLDWWSRLGQYPRRSGDGKWSWAGSSWSPPYTCWEDLWVACCNLLSLSLDWRSRLGWPSWPVQEVGAARLAINNWTRVSVLPHRRHAPPLKYCLLGVGDDNKVCPEEGELRVNSPGAPLSLGFGLKTFRSFEMSN